MAIKNKKYDEVVTSGLKVWQVRLYLIDLLKALHYCHEIVKVVHKDIKPDNIMVGHDQEAVLIDFGVASIFECDENSPGLHLKAGTYMYFAPEMFIA